jgi:hypothetical protein
MYRFSRLASHPVDLAKIAFFSLGWPMRTMPRPPAKSGHRELKSKRPSDAAGKLHAEGPPAAS